MMAMMSVLLLFVALSFPPGKYEVLSVFCRNWLVSEPVYCFPLDLLAPEVCFCPRLDAEDKQKVWQMRKKHGLTGVPFDINRDGIVNFIDYAHLMELMDELNRFVENK